MKIDANDIAAERGAEGLSAALEGLTSEVDVFPTLRNFTTELVKRKKKDAFVMVPERTALPLPAIVRAVLALSRDGLFRVGTLPFVDIGGTIRTLDNPDRIFAWIGENWSVSWSGGLDKDGVTLTPKKEYFASIQQNALIPQFRAVEELPHWPAIPGHYYAWKQPADFPPEGYVAGEYLDRLCAFFTNAATPEDNALIKAMFLTPAWGGLYGTRPAFVIEAPDRGCGKTTLGDAVCALYGGAIDFDMSKAAEEDLATRLLSEGGLTKRIVRVDNLKKQAGSGLVENLITGVEISGKRLFFGEASRPNTLCWIITANGLRMTRDMAERSFVVSLKKIPMEQKVAGWRKELFDFIAAERPRILADIGQVLCGSAIQGTVPDRWAEWVAGVLGRCVPDVESLKRVVGNNQKRRDNHDDDLEEALEIQEAVDEALQSDATVDNRVFWNSAHMVIVANKALNLDLSAKKIGHILTGHIESGRLERVERTRKATAKGYYVTRPSASSPFPPPMGRDSTIDTVIEGEAKDNGNNCEVEGGSLFGEDPGGAPSPCEDPNFF